MMAQNRQQDIDRKQAESDYKINIKAELEIELLHQKIDSLRENEVLLLTKAVSDLTELLKTESAAAHPKAVAAPAPPPAVRPAKAPAAPRKRAPKAAAKS